MLDAAPIFPRTPSADVAKRLKAAGVALADLSVKRDAAPPATRWRADFARVGALDALREVAGGSMREGLMCLLSSADPWKDSLALRAEADGSFTLDLLHPVRSAFSLSTEDSGNMLEALEAVAPLMEENGKAKYRVVLDVPGTVEGFEPKALGRAEEATDPKGPGAAKGPVSRKVSFAFTSGSDFGPRCRNAGEYRLAVLSVRFRLPDGAKFPDAALWPAPSAGGGDGKGTGGGK